MTDILELAKRVEALDGPDREVDRAIGIALALPMTSREATGEAYSFRWVHAKYTASLDAAMTLTAADDWREIKGPRKYLNIPTSAPNYWSASIESWNHEKKSMGWGSTPALALVAAALRAKEK